MSEVMIPVRGGGTSSDDVTASRSNILQGKTTVTSDSDDEIVEGTMPNCGAKTAELACGESYPIPEGYHDGKGKVTAKSLASQTSANAGAGDILSGKTVYVNGSKVIGTMANQGAKTASLNCGGSYTIPAGYHNGSGKVTANSLASQTGVQSGKTAISAGVVRSGYEGWVNGSRVSGNMTNYTGNTNRKTITPSTAQQTWKIPAGYHDGNGYVAVNAAAAGSSAAIFGSFYCWNSSTDGNINTYPNQNKANIDANGTDGFKIKYAGKYKIFAHLYSGSSSTREMKVYKNSVLQKSVSSQYGCANINMDIQCNVNDILQIKSTGRCISTTVFYLGA